MFKLYLKILLYFAVAVLSVSVSGNETAEKENFDDDIIEL